jgi:hypothetical protein
MDGRPTARPAATDERTITMADLRRCIGSARFGIEAHEAPIEDFPSQPSQKDGLGRMCKSHWNQYTTGLARDAKARKTASEAETVPPAVDVVEARPAPGEPTRQRTRRPEPATPVADSQRDSA